jgi:hypothetical protein
VFRAAPPDEQRANRQRSGAEPPSPATIARLREWLAPDLGFYARAQARFLAQHAACGISEQRLSGSPTLHAQVT